MISLHKIFILSALALVVTGCSSTGKTIEPSPLVSFQAENKVNILWSKNIGSSFGDKFHQLTPAVEAGSVLVSDTRGKVSSYELSSGKLQWMTDLGVSISSGVGARFGVAVVTTTSGDVVALSTDNGDILWQVSIGGEVVSRAQLNKDIVVLKQITGDIVALDKISGEQRWIYASNQPSLTLRGTSAPLVALDATLVGLDNGKFIALDNRDGHLLWQRRLSFAKGVSDIDRLVDIDGQSLLYKNVIYVPSYRGNLTAINPFDARVLWQKPYSSYRSIAAANNTIFLSSASDIVHGIDASSAAEIWRQDLLLNRSIGAPVALATSVAVGDAQGYLHFLSQEDGSFIARYKFGGALVGDMIVKDDVLYALSNNGRLTALRLQ